MNGRTFTKDELALLGTAPDQVIAKRLGVTRSTVVIMRQAHGIPYYRGKRKRGSGRAIDLSQEIIEKLGTMSDLKLAEIAGVSLSRISVERYRRNVPSFDKRFHSAKRREW